MAETKTRRERDGAPTHTSVDTAPAPDTSKALERLGRFELVAKLGAGGMGDVYRAYDTMLDRSVALKVLRTKDDADGAKRRRRILREARAAAALTHPNAVTIYEVGEADDEVFLAMELLEGKSLRHAISDVAPLEQRLTWLLQAARALDAAHARGLVHRDVKPDNIFVCDSGVVKLLDFGIAKRDEGHADILTDSEPERMPSSLSTGMGHAVGTPRYMAPEQRAGAPTDARTDQFAWGLVAFEVITGSRADSVATASMLDAPAGVPASADDARIETLARFLPHHPEVVTTVERALRTMQDERLPSMAPIVNSLERALAKESATSIPVASVSAPPAVESPPLLAPARGPKAFRLVAALGAVVLVAAAVGASRYFRPRADAAGATSDHPAFAVVGIRDVPVPANAPVALLPGGDTVIGKREGDAPFRFERVLAKGGTQELKLRGPLDVKEDVLLQGVSFDGAAGVVAANHQAGLGTGLFVWREDSAFAPIVSSHLPAMVLGAAATTMGKRVFVATVQTSPTASFALRLSELGTLTSDELAAGDAIGAVVLEHEGTRLGVAYVADNEIHFDLVDDTGERIGDSAVVAKVPAAPAIALSTEGTAVFWVAEVNGTTRLWSSWRDAKANAFSPPALAVPGAAVGMRPLVTRVPNGWLVMWVAADHGQKIVRVGRVGPKGGVTGAIDVANVDRPNALLAIAGHDTIDVAWVDETSRALGIARLETKK